MIVQVSADASHNEERKLATFAYWIEGPGNIRIKHSGVIMTEIEYSTLAELTSLGKAVMAAVNDMDLKQGDTIVARTDCDHAEKLLSGQWFPRSDRPRDKDVVNWVRPALKRRGIRLMIEHTSAHQPPTTPWKAMNNWCDHTAKAEMFAQIATRQLFSFS